MAQDGNGAEGSRAPSLVQIGRRLMLVIAIATLVALALWLWLSWKQTRAAHLQRMDVTVKLMAAHADHYFGSIGLGLQKLAAELEPRNVLVNPQAVRPEMLHVLAANTHLFSIALIRPDGQMLVTTAAPAGTHRLVNVLTHPDWRADFARDLKARGLSINRPQHGYYAAQRLLHVRYPVRDARGQVRYLIQAAIPLERQQALWRDLGLRPDTNVGLLRDDGYFISRIPDIGPTGVDLYGRAFTDTPLYRAIGEQGPGGQFEGAGMDGQDWIGVFRKLDSQPLYAFLAHRRASFVALWWQQVRLPLALALLFLVASGFAYAALVARYRRRMHEVQQQLDDDSHSATVASAGVGEIDELVDALARSREKLREAARNRERLLVTAARAGTYTVREHDDVIVSVDTAFLHMLGRSEAEVLGQPWSTLIAPEDVVADADAQELSRRVVRVPYGPDGSPRWITIAEYRDTTPGGERVRHGLAIDVSDRERLLTQVYVQSERLQALWQLATSRDMSDEQKMRFMLRLALDALDMDVVLVNELQGERLVVRRAADTLQLFNIGQELPLDDTLCRRAVASRETEIVADLTRDPELSGHVMVTRHGLRGFGSVPVWEGGRLYGTMTFLRRAPLDGAFGTDERAFMETLAAWFGQMLREETHRAELERLAMTDSLTQLLNRRAAEQRLGAEVARARRSGATFAVAICDLDHFKLVNDHYGHDVGDQVLVHVAALIRGALREGDWVARWGGEEFIVFMHQSDAEAASTVMERLRQTIRDVPFRTVHGPLDISCSIGIGTWHADGDMAAVLSEADGCLYEAKRGGRDRVVISGVGPHGTLWRAGMLQHALADGRVVPAYQVIVDLRTGEAVADEALARLIEPGGRVLPACDFIEAAEGINLIHAVDETVSRQTMRRCAANVCRGVKEKNFAHFVNLSAQFLARRELVQGMLRQAAEYCQQTGMVDEPVKPLVLEITERQLLRDFDSLRADLQPLLDYGFRLALDDFGSGYSSFLYLASLPISFLKIEGWLVRHVRSNPRVLAMVKSIIALARDQGITTIAECVEDAETADYLRELGVDWAQGWYFGRPQCETDMPVLEPQPMPAGAGKWITRGSDRRS